MKSHHRVFLAAFSLVTLAGSSLPLLAQDTANTPPSRGWRKFNDSRPADPAASRTAPAEPSGSAFEPSAGPLTLPAGTFVTVRLNEPLSSDHNRPGDTFTATLSQPLVANGLVIARRGQTIAGRVAEAEKAGRIKGTSKLGFELTEITVADGTQVPVHTQLMQYSGNTSQGQDAATIGATTGIGAAIGAAVDGGFGAGMGAIGGAVVSTIGVLATRGRATEVYPEAQLTFRTTEPVTVDTERAPQAFEPVRQQDYEKQPSLQRRAAAPPPPVYYPSYPPFYGPYLYGPGYYGARIYIGGGRRHRRF